MTGKCSYVGAELTFAERSAKVSLMLDNPFLVASLCKLNHTSLCFIQISTKSAYSLQGKQCFFWSHPRCFGPLGKFQHNIKISIKTARVSRRYVSYDYDWIKLTEVSFWFYLFYYLKSTFFVVTLYSLLILWNRIQLNG